MLGELSPSLQKGQYNQGEKMRFVLECKICKRILNEVMDESYQKIGAYKVEIVCEDCRKNLKKLKEKNEN